MPEKSRSKLFVSYSRFDVGWRDRFLLHLRERFAHDLLWVDQESIDAGVDPWKSIEEGVRRAKCALLLLTPHYLDCDHPARTHELQMLIDEQRKGLHLLPVLVEPCSWEHVPGLTDHQLVGWPGDELPPGLAGPRAVKRAIVDAVPESDSPQDRDAARNRAVLAVCDVVSNTFGIRRQLTEPQRNELPKLTEDAFMNQGHGQLTMNDEPFHSGEFALVYHARLDGEPVALKVVPTNAWRHRVEQALSIATTAKNLRGPTFIRMERVVSAPEVHAVAMEYVDRVNWPTLHERLDAYPGRRLPRRSSRRCCRSLPRRRAKRMSAMCRSAPCPPGASTSTPTGTSG